VSPQYLSEIERGLKEPSSEILAAIGESLDTTLLDLTVGVARRLHADRAAAHGEYTLAA
jgi:transcriptional regulator with XRE-family HTH domain